MADQESDFPQGIGAPATRALVGAGYSRLNQLAGVPVTELKQLHAGWVPRHFESSRRHWKRLGSHSVDCPCVTLQPPSSRRLISHPGLATCAPRASARRRNSRSDVTSVTSASEAATTETSVSSPLPGACTTVTPLSAVGSAPSRALPSRTTTTGSWSRPACTADRSRSRNFRAAPGRSRHHPSGREPITFAASIRSTRPVCPPLQPAIWPTPVSPVEAFSPAPRRPSGDPGPCGS